MLNNNKFPDKFTLNRLCKSNKNFSIIILNIFVNKNDNPKIITSNSKFIFVKKIKNLFKSGLLKIFSFLKLVIERNIGRKSEMLKSSNKFLRTQNNINIKIVSSVLMLNNLEFSYTIHYSFISILLKIKFISFCS